MKKLQLKAVIFDLDETLLKSRDIKWAHYKASARKFYNIEVTDDMLREHWGKPRKEFVSALYGDVDSLENITKAHDELGSQYLKELFEETPGVIRCLLEKNIKIGIVSSARTESIEKDLRRLGLPLEKFLFVHGDESTKTHKPDPEVFDLALEILSKKGIKKNKVAYVGDALTDLAAAKGAGIHFIAVTTGLISKKEFKKAHADYVLEHVGQLESFIS